MRQWLAATGLALLLAGCASPPPPAGPMVESGVLQGDIVDGAYHDRRHWVAVGLPFPPSDARYNYIRIKEEYPSFVAFVSFTPLSNPGEYYRIYVEDFKAGGHPVPSLDDLGDTAMRIFGKQLTAVRIEPIQLLHEEPWHTGSTQGLMRLYSEKVPSQLLMQNLGMAEDYTAYILLYVTVQSDKVVVLWMEWPHDCAICVPIPAGTHAVGDDAIAKALAEDARAQDFLGSLRYTPEATAP